MSDHDDDQPPSPFVPRRVPDERPGQEGGRRHSNRVARTRTLAEAALTCFLTHGIDTVSIDDVTRAASISKGSFYRYFENKEALVATLFRPTADAVEGAMTRSTAALEAASDVCGLQAAYAGLAADLMPVLLGEPGVVRLYLQERHGPPTPARAPIRALDARVAELAVRITLAGRKNGLLRRVDAETSARAVTGAVLELLWDQLNAPEAHDPVARARDLVDIVLYGVRAGRDVAW